VAAVYLAARSVSYLSKYLQAIQPKICLQQAHLFPMRYFVRPVAMVVMWVIFCSGFMGAEMVLHALKSPARSLAVIVDVSRSELSFARIKMRQRLNIIVTAQDVRHERYHTVERKDNRSRIRVHSCAEPFKSTGLYPTRDLEGKQKEPCCQSEEAGGQRLWTEIVPSPPS